MQKFDLLKYKKITIKKVFLLNNTTMLTSNIVNIPFIIQGNSKTVMQ